MGDSHATTSGLLPKAYGPQGRSSSRHRSLGKAHPGRNFGKKSADSMDSVTNQDRLSEATSAGPMDGITAPGRLSETTSAVDMDGITKQITVMVPPCLAGTPVGSQLAMRLIHNTWQFQLKCDPDEAWSGPTPAATINKIQRRFVKKYKEPVRTCALCETATRSKCDRCFAVYYCGQECQKEHWPQHRLQCKATATEEHLCIAIPDYRCFWQYKHAVDELADPATMGVMVISRDRWHAIIVHSQSICTFTVTSRKLQY